MNTRSVDTSCAVSRAVSPALDAILGHAFPVLDHGFIRVVDYLGNDQSIVEAARVSYGSGTKEVNKDQGLINYLMSHSHSTPFEMCEIKLHVKLPILVMRQWVRHRMANINEYSARYSVLDREFYIPETEDLAMQSTSNNQGRGKLLDTERALHVRGSMIGHSEGSYDLYKWLLDEEYVARELARSVLPVNIYTQMYWKCDLHNFLHFLRLRADSHAQKEFRVYAELLEDLTEKWVPMASSAFNTYKKNAITFSEKELRILRGSLTTGIVLDPNIVPAFLDISFSKREWGDFLNKLKKVQ